MELTIGRKDLRPEYQNIHYRQTEFEHFTDETQQVIKIIGYAIFLEHDRKGYNRICAPLPPEQQCPSCKSKLEHGAREIALGRTDIIASIYYKVCSNCGFYTIT